MANLERIAYMNHRIKTHGFVTQQEVAESGLTISKKSTKNSADKQKNVTKVIFV